MMNKQEEKELRQNLDRTKTACDTLFNMRATITLIATIIESLDIPGFKGLTIMKSRAMGRCNALEEDLHALYRHSLDERTEIEKMLPVGVQDDDF